MKLNLLDFEELDRIRIRLIILGGVVIMIFSLLASRLWYLQISQGEKYLRIFSGQPHSPGSGTCFAWKYL